MCYDYGVRTVKSNLLRSATTPDNDIAFDGFNPYFYNGRITRPNYYTVAYGEINCTIERHYFHPTKSVRVAVFCECKLKCETFPGHHGGLMILNYRLQK